MPRYLRGNTSDIETPTPSLTGAKYIYMQIFAEDLHGALDHGKQTGFLTFTGQESTSLQITFAATTAAAQVVDVIGWQHKYLCTGQDGSVKSVAA